jgi:hypothetical protein
MTDHELLEYAIDMGTRCEVTSWMDLKKILLVSLPPLDRSRFSTRDSVTKCQVLNQLETKITKGFQEKTGIKLELPR